MTPLRFALKEIKYRPLYAFLFVSSIAVGTAGLMALAGVSGVVKKTVTVQAKELWSADITVKGSEVVLDHVEAWARQRWPTALFARSIDTLSMAQHRRAQKTGQVTLSGVSDGYPLYGKITTGSGRPFSSVLKPGALVVGERLLKGWNLSVGDTLRIGALNLTVADTVVDRTDVPTSFFELSPTVFISLSDLKKTNLLTTGSRASNTLCINLPPGTELAKALAEVKAQASSETTEVASWATDNPGILKFIQRTILYLDFLALLTLTLGGIGAATALSAALKAGEKSVGMMFALGAPPMYVSRAWVWWVGLLSAAGLGLALGASRLMAGLLLKLFGDLLPSGLVPAFPVEALALSAGVGIGASLLFTVWPLLKLGDLSPTRILADDFSLLFRSLTLPSPKRRGKFFDFLPLLGEGAPKGRMRDLGSYDSYASKFVSARGVFWVLTGGTLFYLLVWAQTGRFLLAGQYVAVLAGAVVVGGGLVGAGMTLFRTLLSRSNGLVPRLAARGLARPLNNAVVFSVALSLTVLLTLFLMEKNLFSQLIQTFPADAPNAFFINIQPSQQGVFNDVTKSRARLFPLIRGRVVTVNGEPVQKINRRGDRARSGDRLTREFGFTFGDDLLPTDTVVEGPGLWDPRLAGPQVSVFDEYKKKFGIRRGDRIVVSVLGRRFEATVSSFRAINQSVRQPFFYFYFRPGLLDDVPHTLMTGLAVPKDELPALQNHLAEALPNVTVIDLSDVAALTGRLFMRLGTVVRALGYFGLSAGFLLLISSLLASLASRRRESALFRALGSSHGQVLAVALAEYSIIAIAGVGTAWVLGTGASALLLHRVFELRLNLYPLFTSAFLGAAAAGLVLISWIVTRGSLNHHPMQTLRHE